MVPTVRKQRLNSESAKRRRWHNLLVIGGTGFLHLLAPIPEGLFNRSRKRTTDKEAFWIRINSEHGSSVLAVTTGHWHPGGERTALPVAKPSRVPLGI